MPQPKGVISAPIELPGSKIIPSQERQQSPTFEGECLTLGGEVERRRRLPKEKDSSPISEKSLDSSPCSPLSPKSLDTSFRKKDSVATAWVEESESKDFNILAESQKSVVLGQPPKGRGASNRADKSSAVPDFHFSVNSGEAAVTASELLIGRGAFLSLDKSPKKLAGGFGDGGLVGSAPSTPGISTLSTCDTWSNVDGLKGERKGSDERTSKAFEASVESEAKKEVTQTITATEATALSYFSNCKPDDPSKRLTGKNVCKFLEESGLQLDDPRLQAKVTQCQGWDEITEEKATKLLGNSMIRKALRHDLAIPDFKGFTDKFKEIFQEAGKNTGGGVATYIPQLAHQNPHYWAAAVCTIDAQRFSIGDADVPFCVQSTCKPITYCAALEINGEGKVHKHVGREPSGRNFNDRSLMARSGQPSIPHNPYINAGAIMTASLVKMDANEWDRYKYMMGMWQKLSGGAQPSFQNDTFMGERATASRNFCLAYMMEEEQAFPFNTDLRKTLEAYFSWCSIEITTKSMAMIAATLANGGICPTTTERIFTHQTVTNCLSLMMSCGMYDYSGRFAFEIGFPAKSGVSGVLCVVIPGVCGIATFSPRLDDLGNSVRGIDFCSRLSQQFPYHVFSQKREESDKQRERHMSMGNPTLNNSLQRQGSKGGPKDNDGTKLSSSLWWSAARGDMQRVRQLAVRGVDINTSDYDGRSPLHLAASEGHEAMVKLLVMLQADASTKDTHGNTPIMDAVREHRNAAKRTLQLATRDAAKHPSKEVDALLQANQSNLFTYFRGVAIGTNGAEAVPLKTLIEVLDNNGISTDSDPRFEFLEEIVPDPFTSVDLEDAAEKQPLIGRALNGKLIVPNFHLFCEKLEELFSKMTVEVSDKNMADVSSKDENVMRTEVNHDALNVMTVDGQRLHLGPTDQYLCAGDLISVALFAVSMELLGLDSVMQFMGTEPSGVKSCTKILNSKNLPYNPFMWNGVLALCSLLEENFGDAIAVIADYWAKLCGIENGECPMQHDEVFEEEDKRKNGYRIKVLVHTSLDLQQFPPKTPANIVVDIFFRLRAIKTSTMHLASISAVLANGGVHPMTNESIFQPDTVKNVLSMMYSAGCEAQSGELSFKVGVPAKSSREGAVLIVLPNIMGLCVVSPGLQENGVSVGGLKFCTDFGNDFNCHVLGGSSTSSAKQDPSLYHFHTDMELCHQLLFAAEHGDMMTLSKLHQLGFSLDFTDYDYRSAAHVAAANGQVKVLKYLSKKGANMQVQDRWGILPMDDAKRKGHFKAAALIQDMVRDDDDDGLSDAGSVLTTSSRLSLNSRGGKSERAACPVAAKMGWQSSAFDCIDEGEEDESDAEGSKCTADGLRSLMSDCRSD